MARTKKSQQQKEDKILWIIVSMILILLLIFALFKLGPLGIIINNIFTYIFGSIYIVIISTIFIYAFYRIFNNGSKNIKLLLGILFFNLFLLVLNAYIVDEINVGDLKDYFTNINSQVFSNTPISYTAGILANSIFSLFASLFTKLGSLLISFVFFFISAILIIPGESYQKFYQDSKTTLETTRQHMIDIKNEKKIEKENRRIEKENREKEELKRQELEEKTKLELEAKQKEQQKIEADRLAQKRLKEEIISNAHAFINLSEKEINGVNKKEEEYIEEYVEEEINDVDDNIGQTSLFDDTKKTSNNTTTKKVIKRKIGPYTLPKSKDMFEKVEYKTNSINKTSAQVKGEKVIEILKNFDIEADLINTYIGPSVTKFEVKPDSSVKVSKIMNIQDNIKMELAAKNIRIEAPIPGRSAVGIEIPNVEPVPVRMLDIVNSIPDNKKNSELLFVLGKDLLGTPVFCELNKMPHLLIAGATGSGKSVCINAIITSFLLRTKPNDVKLVLVDPKKVEFTPYKDIPHLMWPIIDDAQMAANMLKRMVTIMEERYELFAEVGVRNIESYNEKVANYIPKEGEKPYEKQPYIVVIIDELADLMTIAKKEVELSIQRITQLARASGIHLIVATQRPSTDVITGLIKSNIPSRISFAVASSIDSRTILDQTGAEKLFGNGDMLYYPQGESVPIRLQGVFVTDKEISNITTYVKSQAKPEYEDSYYEFVNLINGTYISRNGESNADTHDSLYDEVVEFVKGQQKASTSLLQRKFGIGYNRAARLIDTLEERGVIGPANGSKPREVYLKPEDD